MFKNVLLATGFLLTATVSATNAAPAKLKIEIDGGKSTLSVTQEGPSAWACTVDSVTFKVKVDGDNVLCHRDTSLVAQGSIRDGKIAISTPDDAFFAETKLKADKTKVRFSKDGATWEFKVKGDKLKVRTGDKKYGKVKFYPETGKTKAKDAQGRTVAACRGMGRPSAALGVFLIPDLTPPKRDFLVLLLLALDL